MANKGMNGKTGVQMRVNPEKKTYNISSIGDPT